MTSRLKSGLVAVALIAACPPAPALAAKAARPVDPPEVQRGRAFFENWEYERAFNTLVPYRHKAGGTPQVDFLIAASACKIAQKDLPARGRVALASLPDRYEGTRAWEAWRQPASEALRTCGQDLQRPIFVAGSAGVSGKFIGKPPEDSTPPPSAMVDEALPEPAAPEEEVAAPAETTPQAAPQKGTKSNSRKLRNAMAGIAATAAAAFLSSLAENAGAAAAEKFKDPGDQEADK